MVSLLQIFSVFPVSVEYFQDINRQQRHLAANSATKVKGDSTWQHATGEVAGNGQESVGRPLHGDDLLRREHSGRVAKLATIALYLADPGEARGCSINSLVIN